jgi:hypothetical protein
MGMNGGDINRKRETLSLIEGIIIRQTYMA